MQLPHALFRGRIIFAFAVLSLTVTFVYRTYISDDSVSAVVCAHRISAVAPISGSLASPRMLAVGARVRKGEELFRIVNTRLDERALIETRQNLAHAEAEVGRLDGRLQIARALLLRTGRELATARSSQVAVLSRRLDRDRLEASEIAAQVAYLERDQERRKTLASAEVISQSDMDAHTAEFEAQRAKLAADRSQAVATEQLLAAVERGEVVDDATLPSTRDLRERSEDARNTIAGLEADLREARARRDSLRQALEEQSALAARQREASLLAKANGAVIEVGGGFQQDVVNGSALLSYVDCDALYVMALVRGRVYRRLGSGAVRKVGVVISGARHPGEIVALDPHPFSYSGLVPIAESVIAKPDSPGEYGYVLVQVRPGGGLTETCPVGAVATVDFAG